MYGIFHEKKCVDDSWIFTWLTTREKNLRQENELVLAAPKHPGWSNRKVYIDS